MSLAERNQSWDGSFRYFQQVNSRTTAPRVWSIEVSQEMINTQWGQLGGAMQAATEHAPAVNEGKKNYVSPIENAKKLALRYIEKKTREGYKEVGLSGTFLDPVTDCAIDFSKPPAQELRFWKPVNSTDGAMLKKANSRKVWWARKRNGVAKVFVCDHAGKVQIYSRTMLAQHDDEVGSNLTWNDRFPHLVEAAQRVMLPNSILLGELAVLDAGGVDRFDLVQSYIKSLTAQSLADQESSGLRPLFYVWDVAFWSGEDWCSTRKISERYELIHQICDYPLIPVEVYPQNSFSGVEEAREFAKANGLEGFVVVDPDGVMGDKAFNFKGKPDRPACATKCKPVYEDDFVAFWDPDKGKLWGKRSTKGSRAGGIKSVALYQYNSKSELVYICDCNSGLTDEMIAEFSDPSKFPQVWKVEFFGRRYMSEGDDTNALDIPRLVEIRTDKQPQECINPRL